MILLSVAFADPASVFASKRTPREPIACEVSVESHDWDGRFVLSLGEADRKNRRSVQKVVTGGIRRQLPSESAVETIQVVDPTRWLVVEDKEVSVKPQFVDWRWPLAFTFVAAGPEGLGEYALRTRKEATAADWGSCILTLEGPGVEQQCVVLSDIRGACVADYAKRLR